MAISTTAAVTIVAKTSPFSSPVNSKLAQFSSLQFPTNLCLSGFAKHCLKSKPRLRTLTLVASKKQTFSSFEELLEKSDKPVVKIDTEKYPIIASKYNIEALPTFILFKDGEPFDRFEGAMGADQLIQRIKTSLEAKQ